MCPYMASRRNNFASHLMKAHKITFANNETNMTLANIRTTLRVLRRCSLAVVDPASPTYNRSALFYFDRLEEIFGRRTGQTALQESIRYMDAFQAALADLRDLRAATENLFFL